MHIAYVVNDCHVLVAEDNIKDAQFIKESISENFVVRKKRGNGLKETRT